MDISIADIHHWIHAYQSLGVVVAFFLPVVEAFFPILPLFAIVTGNAMAFGLWEGFAFTWLGACTGSLVTFWLVRKLSKRWSQRLYKKYKGIEKTSRWFEHHGFSVLFLLRCLPFSPSSLINVMAGLSSLPFHTYFWATILGKAVMIFFLSFIGSDLPAMLREPWKLALSVVLIVGLWLVGKQAEKHYLQKTEID